MSTLNKVQIFPAIGIARIGNSPEWYLGPELPFPATPPLPPGGTYKDELCRIKRQAQRFRLFGFYSDGTNRELTLEDGDIKWTVHLVNSKGVVTNDDVIDGGLQTLDGAGVYVSFQGTFSGTNVPLGEAETDAQGRLIVVGGYGKSANPSDPASQPGFPNTKGWHDDVSDGPITAEITIGGTTYQAQGGAWVICPPPRYAPTTYSITSLYDILRQLAITQHQLPNPGTPSFANDVYPILKRALDMRYVAAFTFSTGDHDTLKVFTPPNNPMDTLANRAAVFQKLRPAGNMPLLDNGGGSNSQLRDFQLGFIQAWSQGTVTPDWPPVVPTDITPDGLTMAALENCVGAAFFPGIEAGGYPYGTPTPKQITAQPFVEPFRLDQSQVAAGDITQGMARPWQGDFFLCSGPESQTAPDSDVTSWWPAARPIGVYPVDDSANKRPWVSGIAGSMLDMANNWHELGFIVDRGLGYPVETEKTNVCKGCFIVTDRNEISKDEAAALIASGESIQDGFFVIVEGLSPSTLGITTANPTHSQLTAWAPNIGLSANAVDMSATVNDLLLENSGNLSASQRITFGYNIGFSTTNAFVAEDVPVTVTASTQGLSGTAVIDLTTRQHVYMADGPISWLSADTRVFKLNTGGQFAGQMLGNDPNGFIKGVIDSLRANAGATANSWIDALDPTEEGSQLEWSPDFGGSPVFNFAVCRVRYRAKLNASGNFRVFFRLFPAMTTSTDYQPATTYRSGGQPGVKIPLLGIVNGEVVTIPFFAEPRVLTTSSLNTQLDSKNIESINPDAGGHETYGYFACWLDINVPGDKRFPILPTPPDGPFTGPSPLESVSDLIRGVHQCLVAEISADLDPIPTGATTSSSDMLAQRNLSIDYSDNPGGPATHRVQHTFTIRPTTPKPALHQGADELLIEWGSTPVGTEVSLYIPGVSSGEILRLADRLYSFHDLKAVDAGTVKLTVKGAVSYVPVPTGSSDLAGLFTLDLPSHVRKGQTYRIVVRQVIDAPALLAPRPPSLQLDAVVERRPASPRHIVGSFQFSVFVKTKQEIVSIIEDNLKNLKRMFGTIPIENRWYPVIARYVQQVQEKVVALGGGVTHVPGHPTPDPHCGPGHDEDHGTDHDEKYLALEGKVSGIVYDEFGDFDGFWLKTSHAMHRFWSRESVMEGVVTRAWRERIAVLVLAEEGEQHEPSEIVFLRWPSEE